MSAADRPVDEEEPEEEQDNVIEIIREFASHRLMSGPLQLFVNDLKETNQKLEVEYLDKVEKLKRLKSDREVLGVQLYSIQQQLSRVQVSLENGHNEYNSLIDARLQEEDQFKKLNFSNEEKLQLENEYSKQNKKYQAELESLYETIRQIELYNEEVKSEIAITRRTAYKTEQSMSQLEKHKEVQDVLVDELNRKIKKLEEQITIYTNQYESQVAETKEATAVLQETANELLLISDEKRQLMVQWKTALSGLSRRDEALAQANKTLQAAESAMSDYDVEIDSVKREILHEQSRNENLVNMKDRLESELQWVEENISKMKLEREQLNERYTLLTKSLQQTDAEARKLDNQAKQLNTDAESLLQNCQVVTQERQKVEEFIQLEKATKYNVSKTVDNLGKEQEKLLKRIHELENESNDVENELARTKVDKLNAIAVNDQIRQHLNTALGELKEKEAIINKYQVEIRQRNDEVEKKMYRVDRLNKKYEKMVESAGGEENLGPLENAIKMLKKETDDIQEECKELERDWLKKQTELVAVTSESNQISENNNELQARITILMQQQVRLTKEMRSLKTEVKLGNQILEELQKDIAKLNALINQNHDNEGKLQHDNFILERGLVDELKALEHECVTLQANINEAKNAKGQLMDEIIDTERQAQMWEKKIQLDKEMKAALDPSVGQSEQMGMEREIHRMELRLDAIKREQERLAQEMERAIMKRVSISNRYSKRGAATGPAKKGDISEMTVATVKKKIGSLKKDVRLMSEETIQLSGVVDDKKENLQAVSAQLEHRTLEYGEAEEACHMIQDDINNLLYSKQLLQERLGYRQKYLRRMKELSQDGIDINMSLQIERRLLAANQAVENVQNIIGELKEEFPHLTDVLDRVIHMCDPQIDIEIV